MALNNVMIGMIDYEVILSRLNQYKSAQKYTVA